MIKAVDGRFIFPDNIRFWCMFSVVAMHCSAMIRVPGQAASETQYAIATVFKFATVGFFLISGFLLGKGLQSRPALQLLGTRIRKVFLPWSLWFVAFVCVRSLCNLMIHHAPFSDGFNLAGLLTEMNYALTNTSTWFVPNLLFSLAVLLLLGRYMQTFLVGATLLIANLFYSANVYGNWVSATHTHALFAFVFYLWLGHQISLKLDKFQRLLSHVPGWILLMVTMAAGAGAFFEAQLLLRLHSEDPMNTLRLSNQIYSVLVVLCLCKLHKPAWPSFVDVSRDIFGIYLSHALVVSTCLTLLRWIVDLPGLKTFASKPVARLLLWASATAVSWSVGLVLTRSFAAGRRTAWLVGTKAIRKDGPELKRQAAQEPSCTSLDVSLRLDPSR